jgi:amidase
MSQHLLQSSAQELQQKLKSGELTSERLVTIYLDQIKKHNDSGMQLKAVISVAPRQLVLQRARELDFERSEGKLRSQLHGIPVILKVVLPFHFIRVFRRG